MLLQVALSASSTLWAQAFHRDADPGLDIVSMDAAGHTCPAPNKECNKTHQCNPMVSASLHAPTVLKVYERPADAELGLFEFTRCPDAPPPLIALA
jgi:hypothetical protein